MSAISRFTMLTLLVTTVLGSGLQAADWPTWRHDEGRSGSTDQVLPATMKLAWQRQLATPQPAWPEDPRIGFDMVPEPVVVGHQLFVASTRNDCVTSYDTRTGKRLWRAFADGPVRFAPLVADGKVVFGSDDGNLYAVDAANGQSVWTYRAAPAIRKVLGNDRLISVWPVRGGPVLDGAVVRFTAGVWPFEGAFLCSVDLATGQPSEISGPAGIGPQYAVRTLKDITPQGYLVVAADKLFIPCGRAVAACLDLSSNKFLSHSYSTSATTNYHVVAQDRWLFHGSIAFDTTTKTTLKTRNHKPVTTPSHAFFGENGQVVAYDLAHPKIVKAKDRRGRTTTSTVLPKLWSLPNSSIQKVPAGTAYKSFLAKNPVQVDLHAGGSLYGHQGSLLFAVDPPKGDRPGKVRWTRKVDGSPASMIAADDRLFVATTEGRLYCFAEQAGPGNVTEPSPPKVTRPPMKRTSEILAAAGASEGFALVLGIGDGKLVKDLADHSQMRLICVDPDPARVKALRTKLDAARLYGHRVSAFVGDPLTCGLPPYIGNLVTSESLDWVGGPDNGPKLARLVFGCLRPYGGTAALAIPGDGGAASFLEEVNRMKLPQAGTQVAGSLAVIKRHGALPGSADWTHEYGDPSNSLMSQDQLVRAPLGVLWFGGPASDGSLFYNRHFWGPSMAVIEGRMFLQGPGKMTAVDVYTGRILWQIPLVDDENYRAGRRGNDFEKVLAGFHFLAVRDGIYIVHKGRILKLDPTSGKQLAVFEPPAKTDTWGRIRVQGDLLIGTLHRVQGKRGRVPAEIQVLNRQTGKVVWKHTAEMTLPLVAVSDDTLYCLDGILEGLYKDWARRGLVPKSAPKRYLKAFDLKTGKPKWKYTTDLVVTWLNYSTDHDVLMASNKKGMVAYRGKNGEELWRKYSEGKGFLGHPESYWDRVIVSGNRVIDQRGPGKAYNILTGDPILRRDPITGKEVPWEFTKKGHHCNYAIASPHLLTFRAASAGFTDVETGNTSRLVGFRSGCRNSLIPANGILNSPNFAHGCVCGYSLFTSLAFTHVPRAEMWSYSALKATDETVRRLGVNLGAPGDRMSAEGTLWLDYPSIGGSSPDVRISATGKSRPFRQHSSLVQAKQHDWVASSGVSGLTSLTIRLDKAAKTPKSYTVRLHFCEPEDVKSGQRVFDVRLGGKAVLEEFDVVAASGARRTAIVREFKKVAATTELKIDLVARTGTPILNGVEIVAED